MASDEKSVQTVPENDEFRSTERNVSGKQPAKQRTRLRCNWKDCRYNAATLNELETHVHQHRKCPKGDCPWEGTEDEKEKKRYVWKTYRIWAAENKYSSIGGECPTCGAKFARQDYVVRHQRRKHGG
ncbi:hypothetical protein MCOR02_012074 [Pyricularia oryzae]|nr:hypothetical protein MCOR02_012074 [Pyricularia oryzae]